MLTDDSAGEQRAVAAAFPGLSAGEQEVTHLLCRKHSDATIRKKFPGPNLFPVANALRAALYNRRTRLGCQQSLEEALAAAPTLKMKEYIQKEWVDTAPAWAHYARCHSSLLLQISTTNSVEGWHSALKHGVKQSMLTWSLRGIIRHLADIAHSYDKRSEKAAEEWMSGNYSDSVLYPGLNKLPGPLQLLILREREEGLLLLQEGRDPRDFSKEFNCDCLFWQQYQLPCRHLFQVDILTGQVLRKEHWEQVKFYFHCYFIIGLTDLVPTSVRRVGL